MDIKKKKKKKQGILICISLFIYDSVSFHMFLTILSFFFLMYFAYLFILCFPLIDFWQFIIYSEYIFIKQQGKNNK